MTHRPEEFTWGGARACGTTPARSLGFAVHLQRVVNVTHVPGEVAWEPAMVVVEQFSGERDFDGMTPDEARTYGQLLASALAVAAARAEQINSEPR
jgi:hypothetical protein